MFDVQWTENGVSGDTGQNVVRSVAEEYNNVIAPVTTHSLAAMVATVTRRKSKSAILSPAKVWVSVSYSALCTVQLHHHHFNQTD